MVSHEDAPSSSPLETLANGEGDAKDESKVAVEEGETPAEGKDLQKSAGSSTGGDAGVSDTGEEEPEKTLALADELFEKGSKAIEDGDFDEAVDCLSRALEIRVSHYGELAPECVMSYYKYGYALLYKAQAEADPLGNVPNKPPRVPETETVTNVVESSESSMASVSHLKQDHDEESGEEGPGGKGEEDDNEYPEGDNEDLAEADEDDSDLDLAWKMLDVSRAIIERCPEDSMEKVNIFSALGEVSVEREDIETSLQDYLKALSILERLVEPDHRRMIEINFRICLVLEVGSKVAEAVTYCEKAISMCKSRMERLHEDVLRASSIPKGQLVPKRLEEIELISGIMSELEKKFEDLQQSLSTPKNVFSEILKAVYAKPTSGGQKKPVTEMMSSSFNSSQVGVANGGFDSPAASTATSNGSVTHLGVVGRGIKRASVNPNIVESSSKKPTLDTFAERMDSSASEVLDSTNN